MTCYCGATDCPSCGPAQGYAYPPLADDGDDDNAEAEAEDRAMQILDDREAEPSEMTDGCMFRNR